VQRCQQLLTLADTRLGKLGYPRLIPLDIGAQVTDTGLQAMKGRLISLEKIGQVSSLPIGGGAGPLVRSSQQHEQIFLGSALVALNGGMLDLMPHADYARSIYLKGYCSLILSNDDGY